MCVCVCVCIRALSLRLSTIYQYLWKPPLSYKTVHFYFMNS